MNKSRVIERPAWVQGLSNQGFWYKYRGPDDDKPLYKLVIIRGYIKTPYEEKLAEKRREKDLERMLAAAADYAGDYQYTLDDAIEQNIKADERLQESLSRTRRLIIDYVRCNPWDYFFTGTIDEKKQDRNDLDVFRRKFTQMIRDIRRFSGADIKFLIVPELHKKGSWHIHGFLYNLPYDELEQFKITDYLPYKLLDKLKKGEILYNWKRYAANFGFNDLENLRDRDAASRYVTTKYMKKDLSETAKILNSGKHLFFASRGLNRPERIDARQAIDEIEKYNDSGGNIKNCPALLGVGTQDRPQKIEIVSSYEFDYGLVEWYSLKT